MKIDGKMIAEEISSELKLRVEKLKERNIVPHLYIITFGKNDQTESYLKQKLLRAEQIGAKITIKRFEENVSNDIVYDLIQDLNKDKNVHGIIIQRPLLKDLDEEKISLAVNPQKDVDGFRPDSTFGAPVALAVLKCIEKTNHQNINEYLNGKKISIVGKGITAGKPTINLFKKMGIKITIIDSKTSNMEAILKNSDIIISAVGKDRIIKPEDIKNGAVLIGIGMHVVDGKLKGDYEEDEIKNVASFYTPTPGGVGPLNVTMLMKNLVEATENQVG